MLRTLTRFTAQATRNFASRHAELTYVAEQANWATRQVGQYLTHNLNQSKQLRANLSSTPVGVRNQIIHFGTLATFLTHDDWHHPHHSNKVVVTVFHLSPASKQNHLIASANQSVSLWHTTNQHTKQQLIKLGLPADKIIVIPLGVDLNIFTPATNAKRQAIRSQLGLTTNANVIGSFQKDGVGWGEGLEPKLIKGPDIFADAVTKLAQDYPLHILLVGPARGYLKDRLTYAHVPFTDVGYLKHHQAIAKFYHALDLYLITSRVEGGPQQILEAFACGIPTIATRTGLIPDLATDGQNAMLCDVQDSNCLSQNALKVLSDADLSKRLTVNALTTIKSYSWPSIAARYQQELYQAI